MKKSTLAIMITATFLFGCNGNDGNDGNDGKNNELINNMPNIIPSLNFWQGKTGFTNITSTSRIILNTDDASTLDILKSTTKILNEDLAILNGFQLEVIENGGEGEKGDIIFNITGFTAPKHDPEAHDESYTITINGKVIITAPEVRGAAYASSTIKQMLIQDFNGKDSLSNGLIQDEPVVRIRGLMLDIGRRSTSVDFIKNYMKLMGYYKMSELQLHFNDNAIIWGNGGNPDIPIDGNGAGNWKEKEWVENTFSGFSVELKNTQALPELSKVSSIHNPKERIFVLTIEDIKELREMADGLGIELTAEIEAPAHAMSFTKVYPDMRHPNMRPDHLDLGSDKTFEVIKAVWDQLSPHFHNVHIGADEYAGMPSANQMDKEHLISKQMVNYMNTMNKYLKEKGHNEIRVWGNYGTLTYPHRADLDKDIVQQVWAGSFADTRKAYNDGFKLINLNDTWYTVPTGNAGYKDTIIPRDMYENWDLRVFSGGNVHGEDKSFTISSLDDPQFLGGFLANWNDLGWSDSWAYTDNDLHVRLRNAIKIGAQKMWNNKTDLPFEEFQNLAYTLGDSPSFNLGNPKDESNLATNKSAYSSDYRNIIYPLGGSPNGEKLLDVNFLGHAGAAIDGDTKSRWIAAKKSGPSAWLSVDLQTEQEVSRIEIDWGKGWASQYEIQVSNNGFDWTTATIVQGAGITNEEASFTQTKARFVRILGQEMGTDEPYQIHEIRIYK